MVSGLRVEDRLEGASNFCPWKVRIVFLLMENELWDVVNNTTAHPIQIPTQVNIVAHTAFLKKDIKAKHTILDAVKDHVIPQIPEKARAFEMWEALINLYQSSNANMKMVLREKLRNIQMAKGESVIAFLTQLK